PPIEQMPDADPPTLEIVDDHRPHLGVVAHAVDEDHGNATILEGREAGAVLVDRGDDDALHTRLHEQIQVVALTHRVVRAVADDDPDVERGAALLRADRDVDEERVVEIGDRESERAYP